MKNCVLLLFLLCVYYILGFCLLGLKILLSFFINVWCCLLEKKLSSLTLDDDQELGGATADILNPSTVLRSDDSHSSKTRSNSKSSNLPSHTHKLSSYRADKKMTPGSSAHNHTGI